MCVCVLAFVIHSGYSLFDDYNKGIIGISYLQNEDGDLRKDMHFSVVFYWGTRIPVNL